MHTQKVLPQDQRASVLALPAGDRNSALLITADRLRDFRLGYLIQKRFPGLLKAWWIAPSLSRVRFDETLRDARNSLAASHGGWAAMSRLGRGEFSEGITILRRRLGRGLLRKAARMARSSGTALLSRNELRRVETQMFGREVAALRAHAPLEPTPVTWTDADSPKMLAAFRQVNPYFLLTCCSTLVHLDLINSTRGLALSQHDGWSPAFKGAAAAEAALYHRELRRVGSTVQVMNTASDAEPILRRSAATLHADDSVAHCVLAVSALGHKMLLEVIERALVDDHLMVFPGPVGGETLTDTELPPALRNALARDFAAGWLGDALRAVKDF